MITASISSQDIETPENPYQVKPFKGNETERPQPTQPLSELTPLKALEAEKNQLAQQLNQAEQLIRQLTDQNQTLQTALQPTRNELLRRKGWLAQQWQRLRHKFIPAKSLSTFTILPDQTPTDAAPPAPLPETMHTGCDWPNLSIEETIFGSVLIQGWAISQSGIEKVEIYLDDTRLIGSTPCQHPRFDVAQAFPNFPQADQSGFKLVWDTTDTPDGRHPLTLRFYSKNGTSSDLTGHVSLDNTTPRKTLPPALSPQTIYSGCDWPNLATAEPIFGSVLIQGWAISQAGIEKVEIYLNDTRLLGTIRCQEPRPDIAKAFPDFAQAEQPGFKLAWDTTDTPDGRYPLTFRFYSKNGDSDELTGYVTLDNTTPRKTDYQRWIEVYEPRQILEAQLEANHLAYRPLISLIMPVYNVEAAFLQKAIESVQKQSYTHWELSICNDASTAAYLKPLLDAASRQDTQLKIKHLDSNVGIALASNQALTLATGEFIALLDHDDELAPHALYEIVKLLNAHPEADFIYSDEDKLDFQEQRIEPFFKPDWSPDLFLSSNYLGHLAVIRAEVIKAIGGFRPGYDGSQDYDLFLRVSEKTAQIYHIPKILYHWRALPNSVASDPTAKLYAHPAAQKALTAYLARQQIEAEVQPATHLGYWRVKYALQTQPTVAIIIPCATNVAGLEGLTQKIIHESSYRQFEFVIIDNSQAEAVQQLGRQLAAEHPPLQILDMRHQPFNFSRFCNAAARHTSAPLLLFLNDDMAPLNPDWLTALVEHAQRPEIGAVGARLLYPDDTLQHVGVIGLPIGWMHAFRKLPAHQAGCFAFPHIIRNCSGVTGACLMTRRELFWQVNGFEEIHLPHNLQDIDLCLKLRQKGYRIVYTPYAQLYHDESKTKYERNISVASDLYEVRYMQQKWAQTMSQDPYYNPNLSRVREDYSLDLPENG